MIAEVTTVIHKEFISFINNNDAIHLGTPFNIFEKNDLKWK